MSSRPSRRRFRPAIAIREFLFLANIDPVLQARVRREMPKVRMVCGDTMNYWIKDHSAALAEVLKDLDVLLINDGEAKMLAEDANLVRAAKKILGMGAEDADREAWRIRSDGLLQRAIISGREAGVARTPFHAPALPLAEVVDPTGPAIRLPADSLAILHRSRRADAGELPHGHVLWRRHGLVCGGAVWHRTHCSS